MLEWLLSKRQEVTNAAVNVEKREPLCTVGGNINLHCGFPPLWKTVWSFLKKLKTELPDDPTIPLPGIYLKKCKYSAKENPHVHRSTRHKSQSRKPKCPPTDKWIKKMSYVRMGVYMHT